MVSAASGSLAPIARKTLGQKLSPPSRNLLLSPEASALREVDSVAANLVLGTLDLLDETESLVKPGAKACRPDERREVHLIEPGFR